MLFSSRLRDMPWRLCHPSYKSKSLSSDAMTSSAKGMLVANPTTTVNKKALAVVNAYVLWTEEKPSTGWSYDKGSEPSLFFFEDSKIRVPLYVGVHVAILPFFILHRPPLDW
ncbi:hypothetical protein BHE74_00020816 [Ensete ventricosum]|nr:hypothetical protein BHE74_00020816 [Ensete ventricosum]RZR85680.1 hypothetical protein BHM03_00012694 [Ensete ventricosum]